MASRKKQVRPEFTRTREFIDSFCSLSDDQVDIVTTWAILTHHFSPKCVTPVIAPYLYITGGTGSGKSLLGRDVLSLVCRNHQNTAGMTGAALFRMIGTMDEETGEVVSNYPCMSMDEIDATFNGQKDEGLRLVLNVGNTEGASIPRVVGKRTLAYPVHCPKILIGIDNGHLPETVTNRSIRIDVKRASLETLASKRRFIRFKVQHEGQEIMAELSAMAFENSLIMREYEPADIDELTARQYEVAYALLQVAHYIGNEDRIREALMNVMTASPLRGKRALYRAIFDLFEETGEDRLSTRQLLAAVQDAGQSVPGNSGKGLAAVLSEDDVTPDYIRVGKSHMLYDENSTNVHRGYFKHKFDLAFMKYVLASEDDE